MPGCLACDSPSSDEVITVPDKHIIRPHDRPRRGGGVAEAHVAELAALGELMLAAAWSDGEKCAVEVITIAEQLKDFMEAEELPAFVSRRLEKFDPASFDVEAACASLHLANYQDRLNVLNLVARVTGADMVVRPEELAYLKRVAAAIGLDPASVKVEFK